MTKSSGTIHHQTPRNLQPHNLVAWKIIKNHKTSELLSFLFGIDRCWQNFNQQNIWTFFCSSPWIPFNERLYERLNGKGRGVRPSFNELCVPWFVGKQWPVVLVNFTRKRFHTSDPRMEDTEKKEQKTPSFPLRAKATVWCALKAIRA